MAKTRGIPARPPEGREPSPEHLDSMWDSDYIPNWRKPATEAAVAAIEKKLGVNVPEVLKKQYLIQNGGVVFEGEEDTVPMKDGFQLWMNAAIDGLHTLDEWKLAVDHPWFESVEDVGGLDRLVVIAEHSESQMCLDYRSQSRSGPSLIYIDVCMTPTEVVTVCDSATDFVTSLIKAKRESEIV